MLTEGEKQCQVFFGLRYKTTVKITTKKWVYKAEHWGECRQEVWDTVSHWVNKKAGKKKNAKVKLKVSYD